MLLLSQELQKVVISKKYWPQILGAFFLFFFCELTLAKNIVVFVPGLNFNVQKFSEIEKALGDNFSYEYFNIDYNKGSVADWENERDQFFKKFDHSESKLFLIAQSLGALLFNPSSQRFEKIVYLSPAFSLKLAPKLICLMAKIPFWHDLKSRNYKEYRLHDETTRTAYEGLCELNNRFNYSQLDSKKALVAIDLKDELVDAKVIEKNVTNLVLLKKALDNKFHHLIVDEKTMAKGDFDRFIHSLQILFTP
ncbi:hypothetical protein M899_1694 [Bacteriovorax sp. BSW11_IV]|nr:hypothetical protein M899_1694 [Bacteriovorax sp. BSW11_IV]